MNLKHRAFALTGSLVLGLGMTVGIVSAQQVDDDEADAVVNVSCPSAQTIDAQQNAPFTIDSEAGETSDTVANAFTVTIDTTCNWAPWVVGGSIGTFEFQGNNPQNTVDSFSGTLFRMDNGSLDSYSGPTGIVSLFPPIAAGPPEVEASVFELLQTADPSIIDSDTIAIFDVAAPGISVATWDASIQGLPLNLADGEYIAPFTVTLTLT